MFMQHAFALTLPPSPNREYRVSQWWGLCQRAAGGHTMFSQADVPWGGQVCVCVCRGRLFLD